MDERFQNILTDLQSSPKSVQVLPCQQRIREEILAAYSLNPNSLLAALLQHTGGILIDHWLRFYGSGELNFLQRNRLCPIRELVVAEDILGGLFLCLESGGIGYFAPDSLEVEDLEIGMGQLLHWSLHGDTDTFYQDFRWDTWREDVAALSLDQGMGFYPFLWAKAERGRTRRPLPMAEIIGLEFDFLHQMSDG